MPSLDLTEPGRNGEPLLYTQRIPDARLRPWTRSIWYCRTDDPSDHARERVLPSGAIQIALNLARDYLTNYDQSTTSVRVAPALVVGASDCYELICTTDLRELMGVVIRPGAFAAFFRERADLFFGQSIALADLWQSFDRSRLSLANGAYGKLSVLEAMLLERREQAVAPMSVVNFSLGQLICSGTKVSNCAAASGLSVRRFPTFSRTSRPLAQAVVSAMPLSESTDGTPSGN